MSNHVPPRTAADDPGAAPPVDGHTDPNPGPDGHPGRAPRGPLARGLGSPSVLVITVGSLALGLWLLVVSSSAGLPAAAGRLLAGLVTVALLAVLATLVHQARRLARQLSRTIAHNAADAPEDQEPKP